MAACARRLSSELRGRTCAAWSKCYCLTRTRTRRRRWHALNNPKIDRCVACKVYGSWVCGGGDISRRNSKRDGVASSCELFHAVIAGSVCYGGSIVRPGSRYRCSTGIRTFGRIPPAIPICIVIPYTALRILGIAKKPTEKRTHAAYFLPPRVFCSVFVGINIHISCDFPFPQTKVSLIRGTFWGSWSTKTRRRCPVSSNISGRNRKTNRIFTRAIGGRGARAIHNLVESANICNSRASTRYGNSSAQFISRLVGIPYSVVIGINKHVPCFRVRPAS